METQSQAHSYEEAELEQETPRDRQAEAEKQRPIPEVAQLSTWQKLILLFKGRVFVRHERREGWSESLKIYAFLCPRHGIQTDYNHGFYERLDCPLCSFSTWGHPPETGFEP